jgi:4-hydroxy-2-oxoheptanedioate aldolase
LVIPIETREALDNLDAILDVPGIDGIYVGPGDLGFSGAASRAL